MKSLKLNSGFKKGLKHQLGFVITEIVFRKVSTNLKKPSKQLISTTVQASVLLQDPAPGHAFRAKVP